MKQTKTRSRSGILAALLAALLSTGIIEAQDPDSPRYRAAMATRQLLEGATRPADFVSGKLAAGLREEWGREGAVERVERILQELDGFEMVGLRPKSPRVAEMVLQRGDQSRTVEIHFEADPPHGITDIAIQGGVSLAGDVKTREAEEEEGLTWENLPARLEKEAAAGLSGVVVVVRDGETVVDEAYGKANREEDIDNRRDTIFGIGSTPIDFTHVGILMLQQQGKLSLDDPIGKYFDSVPDDKKAITIDHLRTGRSGLQDFHDTPQDENPDHAWIDRDEAIRRILGQTLLFEPGKGRAHSHSAWGVLAAILEIVSGKSYQEFTTEKIFKPLGMKDTGFYGTPIPKERMAVAYGVMSNGEVNAPPYWGKTSWLVLGSGGQVSTAPDMIRFVRGIRTGKLLNEENNKRLTRGWGGPLAGGSIFGYEIVYTANPNTMMILMSNSAPDGERSPAVLFGLELAELTLSESLPGFSLGIGIDFDSEAGLTVSQVMPGSAAERDGLRAGDALISVNGAAFGEDPLGVLDPFLRSGERMEFEVRREGKPMKIGVKPNPR